MSKLQREIEELKLLDYEQLLDKKNYLLAERVKIESKLTQAKLGTKTGEEINDDWFSRTKYAFSSTEALIGAIGNELLLRDRRSQAAYERLFVETAKAILPVETFNKIANLTLNSL